MKCGKARATSAKKIKISSSAHNSKGASVQTPENPCHLHRPRRAMPDYWILTSSSDGGFDFDQRMSLHFEWKHLFAEGCLVSRTQTPARFRQEISRNIVYFFIAFLASFSYWKCWYFSYFFKTSLFLSYNIFDIIELTSSRENVILIIYFITFFLKIKILELFLLLLHSIYNNKLLFIYKITRDVRNFFRNYPVRKEVCLEIYLKNTIFLVTRNHKHPMTRLKLLAL